MTKRQQKQVISALITLLVLGISIVVDRQQLVTTTESTQSVAVQSSDQLPVVSIEDGDTITVLQNGQEEKVRLLGVDTPEVRDPRKAVQCYGKAASQFTTSLIGTNTVRLEADPENADRDRYQRLLRYVYLPDGTLVNAEIIKQGYGFAYLNYPITKSDEFKRYEDSARQENRGLWGSCSITDTNSGNHQTNNAE